MAVYVDDAVWPWKGTLWCHLLADDLDELHRFARQLGMEHRWFQHPPHASSPHYDLTIGKRAQAIHLGALEIDRRTTVIKARALRVLWLAEQPSNMLSVPPSQVTPVRIMVRNAPASTSDATTDPTRRSMFPRPGRRP